MSRALSTAALDAINSQESSEIFHILLTLDHADLVQALRVTNNNADVVSNGDTYVTFPFEITLPEDSNTQAPVAKLTIDNVDRQIVQTIRSISTPLSAIIQIVLASTPDTVEAIYEDYILRNTSANALTVSGSLTLEDFLREPYPSSIFSPADFPGLF